MLTPLVAFISGLSLGIVIWWSQRLHFHRQLTDVLNALPITAVGNYASLISNLRRGVRLSSQRQFDLESQLQTWQQLIQVAPLGFLLVDSENQLLACNTYAQHLLHIQNWGFGRPRLMLEVIRSYELDQLIEQTRRSYQPQEQEWLFYPTLADPDAAGRPAALTLHGYTWPLNDGRVAIFLENRQPVIELSRSRDQWMVDLAHELKTPLTSIQLVAEALHSRLDPPLQVWVSRLLQEVTRLITLVQNWLDLSQMSAQPPTPLATQQLDLPALIRAAWQTLEPQARQKHIALAYVGPETLVTSGDEMRLYRAFLNLLDNALKYSPPEASIEVHITPTATDVHISVIDHGPGFPETDLPHVFERFYRGQTNDPMPLSRSNGSGLGLAIVEQIILAHRGMIRASNHPKTGGAWLQITLPGHLLPTPNPQTTPP
ncbi:MAG: HAMP domain-containing histidine kinase [Gloeomargaritaceae cyanobacterium C42_A2020_066]|nr:HAMP domain-containing histidine kinase [Gloeomargaritaceae cyanobacterium C42_A2020_066]